MNECVYVICEKEKKFTNSKNKCNTLYVGESKNFKERKKVYMLENKNNELKSKLWNKLFVKGKEDLLNTVKFTEHIVFRTVSSCNFKDEGFRKEFEGYLINRLNPLLNKAKKEAKFKRTFKNYKRTYLDWSNYQDDLDHFFSEWYWNRTDIHGTDKIMDPRTRKFVDRDSFKGEEIEEYNYNKKFESWKELNKVNINFDKWRTNFEKWRKDLRFR
tara:strand:+ start:87 stop:731 length:645 start_codon:yes stop_codon:yes gene_type:complete